MDPWRRWRAVGVRVPVALTMAVAVLSLVTGLVNIGSQTLLGPVAVYVPEGVQRAAGFTGALTGFAMMVSALGLRRGLRVAWYAVIVLLPVTALQGLVQSSPFSVPLVVLSVVSLPAVALSYRRYDREVELSTAQMAAGIAVIGAQAYGTVGTYALRSEFTNVRTLGDAFYYTLVTASTVGYGDLTPTTQGARLFSMSVIVVGTASFAIAVGTLLGPLIEARFSQALGRMTAAQLEVLEDHILVLGYGDLTESVLDELEGEEFIVVTQDERHATELSDRGIQVLTADPTDEDTLRRANVAEARAALVATNNDAQDALVVLTVRDLSPDMPIIAAATHRENVAKLRHAGADTVISPAAIGGRLLAQSVLGEEGMEDLADRVLDEAGGGS
ncbi:MAG: NAD-binding protein [Halobacteriaceae archaeon]